MIKREEGKVWTDAHITFTKSDKVEHNVPQS